MKHPKGHQPPGHERWLISYADFVTLIFALFVVLFASSQSDHKRQVNMAEAMQAAFTEMGIFPPATKTPTLAPQDSSGALGSVPLIAPRDPAAEPFSGTPAQRAELEELQKRLQRALSAEIRNHTVAIRLSRDGLVISMMELGFFNSGSAIYKPSSAPTIARIAGQLRDAPNNLRIEGHTDDVPIHSEQFASNWELSTARATGLARMLIEQYHFDPARLSAAGYAQYHPEASNTTAAGRALNRRVDVVVLPVPAWMPPRPRAKPSPELPLNAAGSHPADRPAESRAILFAPRPRAGSRAAPPS